MQVIKVVWQKGMSHKRLDVKMQVEEKTSYYYYPVMFLGHVYYSFQRIFKE